MQVVGREAELALVTERLGDRRLVTLVGPGGIGKTALARAALERCEGSFGEGSRVVDLTKVDTAEAVRESLAAQLGYTSFRALLEAPGDHSVLVLVDNCEHVIEAAADVVAQLLDACQMPTVLATSRAALELPGEVVVAIGPLEVPPAGVVDAPAVQLFVERARDAGSAVDPGEVAAELCRRLDGVPLAIELAAARTRSLTPAEILTRIGDGLDVLDRPRWRGARRHQSLRAAVQWSYALLDAEDQRSFDALGVFPGPFTADLAVAVTGVDAAALDRLVAASMVAAEHDGDVTRYRELDTLRMFAREHLDARGERAQMEARFVEHIAARVAALVAESGATWAGDALRGLVALYEHIVTALRWSLQHDDRPDRAFLLGAALWAVVHQGHADEIAVLAEQVLERWADATRHPLHADVVATAATCWYMRGDIERAVTAALDALTEDSRSFAPVTLRRVLGQSARAVGDTDDARRWFSEAAERARALGLTAFAVEADAARAQILADVGDVESALALVRRARADAASAGAGVAAAWADVVEGSILLRVDVPAATRVLDAALDSCRQLGYAAGTDAALRARAFADLLVGDVAAAATRTAELLERLLASGSVSQLRLVCDVASTVLANAGRDRSARDLAATALALPVVSITTSVGHELFPLDRTGGRELTTRQAILVARAELATVVGAPSARSVAEDERVGIFRRAGELWEVGFAGALATVRGSKGMDDLAVLLAATGREVHCVELVGGAVVDGGVGPAIDAAARRAYEERVRELQRDIDEADADNDRGRAERARVELDAIVDALAAALGLGGRVRDGAGSAERARQAVTQRVRSTIKRLDRVDPRLGRHLATSVRTGTFCSYSPEVPVRWQL